MYLAQLGIEGHRISALEQATYSPSTMLAIFQEATEKGLFIPFLLSLDASTISPSTVVSMTREVTDKLCSADQHPFMGHPRDEALWLGRRLSKRNNQREIPLFLVDNLLELPPNEINIVSQYLLRPLLALADMRLVISGDGTFYATQFNRDFAIMAAHLVKI